VIESLPDDIVDRIGEICFNVLNRHIEIKKGDKKKLKKIKPSIKTMADPDVNIQEKRKLLCHPQVGSGLFTLFSSILPFLISLIRKN
jgi:hypothetical protein